MTSAEIFDPSTDRWTAVGDILEPRQDGVATVLQDRSVPVQGGIASFDTEGNSRVLPPALTSVEHFYPGP